MTIRRKVYEFQVLLYNFEMEETDQWKKRCLDERKEHLTLVKDFCNRMYGEMSPYTVTVKKGRGSVYGTFSNGLSATGAKNTFIYMFSTWISKRR